MTKEKHRIITKQELLDSLPDISQATIKRTLGELVKNRDIKKLTRDVIQNIFGAGRIKRDYRRT